MPSNIRRSLLIVVMVVALIMGPAAAAFATEIYTAECPPGYKGIIVGVSDDKWGTHEAFVCTNIIP